MKQRYPGTVSDTAIVVTVLIVAPFVVLGVLGVALFRNVGGVLATAGAARDRVEPLLVQLRAAAAASSDRLDRIQGRRAGGGRGWI